jgi:hypothetical protein
MGSGASGNAERRSVASLLNAARIGDAEGVQALRSRFYRK